MANSLQTNTPLPTTKRIAFIVAGWHQDIVEQSFVGFKQTLSENGIASAQIDIVEVPGSLEIPLQCKLLAQNADYSIIVAAGLIVNGGIYRHDFVAATVLDAMMAVQLDSKVPIISIVLTPHEFDEQNKEHQEFFFKHFKLKGKEAARACLQLLTLNN